MSIRSLILLATILTVSACQSETSTKTSQANGPAADIVVRATSDLDAPSTIVEATFVPNSIATWLGHIIMIDKAGNLHRSTTDSQVQLIDKGDYKSVIGLTRIKQPGVFLAVTKSGSLKSFIESDDEGNFKALPISISAETRLTKFCQNAMPSGDKIWAMNKNGTVKGFTVIVTDNASVALDPLDDKESTACASLTYDAGKSITLDKTTSHLLVNAGGQDKTVSITNGLSIGGISNPAYVGATTANMGSVYRGGVILTTDKDSGRIVLIARDYFVDEMNNSDASNN